MWLVVVAHSGAVIKLFSSNGARILQDYRKTRRSLLTVHPLCKYSWLLNFIANCGGTLGQRPRDRRIAQNTNWKQLGLPYVQVSPDMSSFSAPVRAAFQKCPGFVWV